MSIDASGETLVTFSEAAKRLRQTRPEKRTNLSVLYRWAFSGCKAKDGMIVRLETIKVRENRAQA